MISRRILLQSAAAGSALFFIGCSQIEPSETLRYRITVEVETPVGLRSGSAVWEYKITDVKVGFTPLSHDYRGEAVAVDLPNGRTLFALLRSGDGLPDYPETVIREKLILTSEFMENSETAFLTVFPEWRARGESWTLSHYLPSSVQNEEPRSAYPMLVTFKDINDPRSIELVDPEDMDKIFGDGTKIKRIFLKVTDDPVTTGIGRRLSWLPSVYDLLREEKFKPPGIPVGDFKGLFSTERK